MSVKFEVNFNPLSESLVDYTSIDDIKAKRFIINTVRNVYYHFLGGITTETNFGLILSFDIECSQTIILFLVLAQYRSSSLKIRINLQRIILTSK